MKRESESLWRKWLTKVLPMGKTVQAEVSGEHLQASKSLGSLGRSQYFHCHFLKAAHYLRAAHLANPNDPDTLYYLGLSLAHLNLPTQAADQFRLMLRIEDNPTRAYQGLAMASGMLGELNEERRYYEKILEYQPNDALTNYELAMTLVQLGDYTEALTAFRKVLFAYPEHTLVLCGKADVLFRLERYSDADRIYRRVLAIHPHHKRALAGLQAIEEALSHTA